MGRPIFWGTDEAGRPLQRPLNADGALLCMHDDAPCGPNPRQSRPPYPGGTGRLPSGWETDAPRLPHRPSGGAWRGPLQRETLTRPDRNSARTTLSQSMLAGYGGSGVSTGPSVGQRMAEMSQRRQNGFPSPAAVSALSMGHRQSAQVAQRISRDVQLQRGRSPPGSDQMPQLVPAPNSDSDVDIEGPEGLPRLRRARLELFADMPALENASTGSTVEEEDAASPLHNLLQHNRRYEGDGARPAARDLQSSLPLPSAFRPLLQSHRSLEAAQEMVDLSNDDEVVRQTERELWPAGELSRLMTSLVPPSRLMGPSARASFGTNAPSREETWQVLREEFDAVMRLVERRSDRERSAGGREHQRVAFAAAVARDVVSRLERRLERMEGNNPWSRDIVWRRDDEQLYGSMPPLVPVNHAEPDSPTYSMPDLVPSLEDPQEGWEAMLHGDSDSFGQRLAARTAAFA